MAPHNVKQEPYVKCTKCITFRFSRSYCQKLVLCKCAEFTRLILSYVQSYLCIVFAFTHPLHLPSHNYKDSLPHHHTPYPNDKDNTSSTHHHTSFSNAVFRLLKPWPVLLPGSGVRR